MNQLKLIWQNRSLIWTLAFYRMKADQKTKALGVLWSFLDPLLFMATYSILIVIIFKKGEPMYPALLFTVLVAWSWFTNSLGRSVTALSSRSLIIQTYKVPNVVYPVSEVVVETLEYFAGLLVLIPILIYYGVNFNSSMTWIILVWAIQIVGTIGGALICTIIGTYLKDLSNILAFGFRLWFYLSPALYSVTELSGKLRTLFYLNPFAWMFESYKSILVRGESPDLHYIVIPIMFAVCGLGLGLWFFNREEGKLAKFQ